MPVTHLAGLSQVPLHVEVVGELLAAVLAGHGIPVLLTVWAADQARAESSFLPVRRADTLVPLALFMDCRGGVGHCGDDERLAQLPFKLDVVDLTAVSQELQPGGQGEVTLVTVSVPLVSDVERLHFLLTLTPLSSLLSLGGGVVC